MRKDDRVLATGLNAAGRPPYDAACGGRKPGRAPRPRNTVCFQTAVLTPH